MAASATKNRAIDSVWLAGCGGAVPQLKKLVEKDPSCVNKVAADGNTPLIRAAKMCMDQNAAYLLSKGAYVNAQDLTSKSALFWACLHEDEQLELVKVILKYGARVNDRVMANDAYNGWTPLHAACSQGNMSVCKLLIEHDADIGIEDAWGLSPLQVFGKAKKSITLAQRNAAISELTNFERSQVRSKPTFDIFCFCHL